MIHTHERGTEAWWSETGAEEWADAIVAAMKLGTGSVEWGYFSLLQQELRRFECRKVGLDHGVGHPSNSCPEWEQLTH